MTFQEWSQLETIQTKLDPSPTAIHHYALPVKDHIEYFGGEPLSDQGKEELAHLMELAFNRGHEIETYETKKEFSHGETET